MLNMIKHRGNGKRNVYNFKKAILGKNQLLEESAFKLNSQGPVAIADEAMTNENGFSSEEVILNGYAGKGDDFVNDLSGPFAFIISDGKKLFAARDPLGLKPLYYTKINDTIIFASEIKALMEHGEKIQVFPPGYYYSSEKGFVKYYNPSINQFKKVSTNKAAAEIKERIVEAVDKSCERDNNPGVFLSGGLDSSVIATACRDACEKLDTFSVGVEGSSDLLKAKKVAKYIGSKHNECIYGLDEMLKVLPEVIYHLESFDMYLVRSAVVNYLLTRSAKSSGKNLIFCGEGADEIFAGYQYLKKLNTEEVNDELEKLIFSSHANGFQRVDRMLTAFSMEASLPFADIDVAEYFKITGKNEDLQW